MKKIILLFIVFLCVNPGFATDLYIPKNIQNAFEKQTRSTDGTPGKNYWQNRANYQIDIKFDPGTGLLQGTESIQYDNNSPDTLKQILFHVYMNIYKSGNPREYDVTPTDLNEGVIIEELTCNGVPIAVGEDSDQIEYIHNDFYLKLPAPLLPEKRAGISIKWHYYLNKDSHFRTGKVDSTTWFAAYFFPRIAVYDDIDGWNDFKYAGSAEFYNDFGDFNLSVTVPSEFLVWATGVLQNSRQLLMPEFLNRYKQALISDSIVTIIDSTEIFTEITNRKMQFNTWRFISENVSDVAFAVSDHYCWEGTSLVVDSTSGRRVFIDAAFNKNSTDFYDVVQIAHQSIQFMSEQFPGVPFPYPNETIFNGLDEMEYPMMVNDFSSDDLHYTIKLTSHEIFHTYFPFYMGTNESKYGWMDEGFASFGDFLIVSALDGPEFANFYYLSSYAEDAGMEKDFPIFANSKYLKRPAYHYSAYAKPAIFLYILQDLLGKDKFTDTIREFMRRWHGKHPIPYDLFNTINHFTEQDLSWLIKPWFFEFGYPDLAISKVEKGQYNYSITVEKTGHYPVPVKLKLYLENNSTAVIYKDASVWKNGETKTTFTYHSHPGIKKIELDNYPVPDADASNNFYIVGP